ncbi:SGNH/GDSL hydrolase family protein [Gilvimarinus polysaccharolyticus]|uniref:SGNH/GDSL hydrolase family protein n=1 Tax=Gilvimarinus polysaccharolyticus TaxID=863921 RepID=UPI000673464B|nr:SGNH/GDSL hydrolase family protein [Gilvimarinus polysaccharolyticus]
MRIALLISIGLIALGGCSGHQTASPNHTIAAQDSQIRWSGRTQTLTDGAVRFGYPSVSANLNISGGALAVRAYSTKAQSYLAVSVDHQPPRRFELTTQPQLYPLVADDGQPHTVRLSHMSETWRGVITLQNFELSNGTLLAPPPAPARKLLVIGDSVTCGEGVHRPADHSCAKEARWTDPDNSYGMLLGQQLNAETQLVCYGGRGLTRSWDGNTRDAQAPQFFNQAVANSEAPAADLEAFVPDVILISLGTNDFSLGIGPLPPREHFVATYVKFVQRLLALYPNAEIALTEGAIVNDAADPKRPQKTVLREYIAATVKRVGSPRLRQILSEHHPGDQCDAHPTGPQHRAMARELLPQIQPLF